MGVKKPTPKERFFHLLLLAALAFIVSILIRGRAESENINYQIKTYSEVLDLIKKYSLYEPSDEEIAKIHECILQRGFQRFEIPKGEIKEEISIESCFKQDKRARYLSPTELEIMNEDIEGFYGIGVQVKPSADLSSIEIIGLLDGGAAKEAGLLKEGDLIIAAGESEDKLQPFSGLSFYEMVRLIRGPANTSVFLKVIRGSKELPIIKVIRKEVKDKFYKIEIVDINTAYLKLASFHKPDKDFQEIEAKLLELHKEGVSNLIIDVRDNPGGFLHVAISFLNLFAPDNKVFLEVHGRENKVIDEYTAGSRGTLADMNVAILINKNSASASELVAGVLQRWGAVVLGEVSYGKGSVQRGFELKDGGSILLTTMTYHFSDGVTPEDGGIEPDIFTDKPLEEAIKYLSDK